MRLVLARRVMFLTTAVVFAALLAVACGSSVSLEGKSRLMLITVAGVVMSIGIEVNTASGQRHVVSRVGRQAGKIKINEEDFTGIGDRLHHIHVSPDLRVSLFRIRIVRVIQILHRDR